MPRASFFGVVPRAALERLVSAARESARRAYAPASSFEVGAAILGANGEMYCGCNVENASYGLTICAERNAAFHAVAQGCQEFVAVAVCTPTAVPGTPCGACRQVLTEFGRRMEVILVGTGKRVVRVSLEELLPRAFRFKFRRRGG